MCSPRSGMLTDECRSLLGGSVDWAGEAFETAI